VFKRNILNFLQIPTVHFRLVNDVPIKYICRRVRKTDESVNYSQVKYINLMNIFSSNESKRLCCLKVCASNLENCYAENIVTSCQSH